MSTVAASPGGSFNWIRLGIEAAVLLVFAAIAAVALLVMPAARGWVGGTLAYGWAPVAALAVAGILTTLHRPSALVAGWRWWLAAAILVAVAIGGLGFVQGNTGVLYAYGFSGRWGYALTGGSSGLAVFQLVIALVGITILLIPGAGRLALIGLRYALIGAWIALVAVAALTRRGAVWTVSSAMAATRRSGEPKEIAPDAARPKAAAASPDAVAPEPPVSLARSASGSAWQLPPLDLLAPTEPHQIDEAAIAAMSQEIRDALAEHGVYVDVEDVKAGPRVIRFGLVPGYMPQKTGRDGDPAKQRPSRVRVGDIAKRQKDLALALKSPYIRIIETPEPGEGLVGLEVPNPSPGKVLMRSIVEGSDFTGILSKGGLPFALGEDAGGQPLALNLAAMPHLLIAGATGSGKSVCINSLVASLLMTRPPDQLRMIMVDPKRVELTPFNGIPHLVTPVIVEPDDVQPALRGLINEMTRRYKLMEDLGVRNIAGYNAKAGEPMPFLVLIVDELADLMMTGGLEVEQQLVRLAQLGRAAGIHMVLATQRPSVKVVTGLLKANVPARVAFAVASQVDSRVILDSSGAEGLMGKGDLLLLNNDFPKARRGQGTLVYDEEMDGLIDFWRNQQGPPLPPINLDSLDDDEAGAAGEPKAADAAIDPNLNYLDQARDIALRNPRVTSVMLEKRFKIRKSVADELMDDLRAEGLVIG